MHIRYGHLRAIGPRFRVARFVKAEKRYQWMQVFRCDCGNVVVQDASRVHEASVCVTGCPYKRQKGPGPTGRPLYNTWNSIIYRCFNPKCGAYSRYGGRGITCCNEWRQSFETFEAWAMQAGWEPSLQIDRIDNDGDYTPENCRFVTSKDNNRNRSSNRFIEAFGERKTIAEWAESDRSNASASMIRDRLAGGWDAELAIATPTLRRVATSASCTICGTLFKKMRLQHVCCCVKCARTLTGRKRAVKRWDGKELRPV